MQSEAKRYLESRMLGNLHVRFGVGAGVKTPGLHHHRKLKRLVAIDLKIGNFEAADKGQMELYLAWLKRHECEPGEAEPLGLILCAGKSQQHIELLELHKSRIHVATYWTQVLPKERLERKLHDAVRSARASITMRFPKE